MKHKFKKQIDAFKAERKFKSSNEYKRIKERADKIKNTLQYKYAKASLGASEPYVNENGESLEEILQKTGGVMAGPVGRRK